MAYSVMFAVEKICELQYKKGYRIKIIEWL